jgi:vitamin B12 transporter
MKKRFCLFVLFGVFVFQATTFAESENKKKAGAVKMDEVVVSVTRTETTLDKVGGSSVTVITAREIEAKKQTSVEEILKSVPGVDIAQTGGTGAKTSVFMRGAESKNTLVLIDGIMINDPSDASRGANLANLNVDNIERIEVVRGAMSVMYGSNATAGVINIITKKGAKEPSLNARVEAGSFGTCKVAGGSSGTTDHMDYSLSASRTEIDGFSTANDENSHIPHAGNTDEDDGYENTTLSGKFGFDISEDFNITAVARFMDSEVDFDDYGSIFPDYSGYAGDRFDLDPLTWLSVANPTGSKKSKDETEQTFGRVSIKNSFFNKFIDSSLAYNMSRQERQSYDNDGAKSYDFDGDSDEFAWQGNFNFSTNTMSIGATYFEEAMESKSSSVDDKDVNTKSYWIQDQLFCGDNFVVVAGTRLDYHGKFGSKATYRLAPSYNIEKTGTTIKASYGTGFRSPSLFELYSSYGNPDLDPEESTGWDVGFEQELLDNKIRFGLTYFNMDFDDRIDYDWATFRYNQLPGETKTNGVEAFAGWSPVDDFDLMFNYTYTDTQDPDGRMLKRRPYNKFALNAVYRFLDKGSVNLDIFWTDDRKPTDYAADANGNIVDKLDSYTVVNIATSYNINDNFQIYCRIDNLFDEYYEEAWSYATPELSGYVGVKYTY